MVWPPLWRCTVSAPSGHQGVVLWSSYVLILYLDDCFICRAWKEDDRTILCPGVRACSTAVRALTTDEFDMVWVGSDKGDVRRLCLTAAEMAGSYKLQLHRYLRHTGSGAPERALDSELDPTSQMVKSLRAKEKAHEGPISSMVAAAGRVWTAGGSSAFVCLREWTQRGEFLRKTDLKSVGESNLVELNDFLLLCRSLHLPRYSVPSLPGPAVSMLLISPIVKVQIGFDQPSSSGSAVSSMSPGNSIAKGAGQVPQAWQLLTGHGNGVVQVWGDIKGALTPLLRIGGEVSPLTAIAVHPPLGLICSSHLDGRMVTHAVPHPNGHAALTVTLLEGTISAVKLRQGDARVAE